MVYGELGICILCKHYSDLSTYKAGKPACRAFPAGIPKEIWHNRYDHIEPYPGDNGILYEPNDYAEKQIADLKQDLLDYLASFEDKDPEFRAKNLSVEATNHLLNQYNAWERRFEIARARGSGENEGHGK